MKINHTKALLSIIAASTLFLSTAQAGLFYGHYNNAVKQELNLTADQLQQINQLRSERFNNDYATHYNKVNAILTPQQQAIVHQNKMNRDNHRNAMMNNTNQKNSYQNNKLAVTQEQNQSRGQMYTKWQNQKYGQMQTQGQNQGCGQNQGRYRNR